jgi:hypothetical protein
MKQLSAFFLVALLVALASDSWGQSKPDSPPREQAKTAQQSASKDQRGTEQFPAFVKIIPTQKTPEEAEADRKEKEQKDTNDTRLVWFTGLLACIGFLQLLVFGWQGIQLKRTVTAAKEATKLARDEFVATHRPKIIVHGMDAKLAGEGELRHVNFRLPSGKNGFAITSDEVNFVTLVRSGRAGHDIAFCVGVVVYRDTNGVERRTGFCRRYDSDRERWLKVEDQDYEYAY